MEHLLEPIKNPTIADAKKTPGAFLKQIMGKPVEVKLRDGTLFKGTLVCLDGCLNVCLEKCCQIDPETKESMHMLHDTLLRGNNVLYIHQILLKYD